MGARGRLFARYFGLLFAALAAAGACLGAFLGDWVPTVYVSAVGGLVVVGAYVRLRFDPRWSLANLERGFDAEYRIGQVIDYALVPPGCAVAHGVTGIGVGGDIDHLVATPGGLWVIETKVRAVPRERLPAVLDRIADNVRGVGTGPRTSPCAANAPFAVPERSGRSWVVVAFGLHAAGVPAIGMEARKGRDPTGGARYGVRQPGPAGDRPSPVTAGRSLTRP